MNRFTAILIIMIIPLALAGCPGLPKSKKGGNGGPQVRLVKGDPWLFVKGTQMNRKNELPLELLGADHSYSLVFDGYAEGEAAKPQENIETGNEAPTKTGKEAAEDFAKYMPSTEIKRDGDLMIVTTGEHEIAFKINSEANTFSIQRYGRTKGDSYMLEAGQFEVLHTSIMPDKRGFNFLIHFNQAPHRFVISIGMLPPMPVKESAFTLDKFYYILGVGVKLIWPQDKKREVLLCHSPSQEVTKAFKQALGDWQAQLKGRLDFDVKLADSCPPFSDLNTQTVTVLDDWIQIQGEQGQAGFTSYQIDPPKGEILDSDIFILLEELAENYRVYRPGVNVKAPNAAQDPGIYAFYFETFEHELGHLLGLHHNFEKNVKSVMGYDPDVRTMQPYDIQAIQALYPPRNSSSN